MNLLSSIAPAVRRASLKLVYEDSDISRDISSMLIGFTYTDHAHGKADDLEITLENRAGLWSGDWRPGQGDKVRAWIVCTDWYRQGQTIEMPCGIFSIDEISLSGGPDTVTIRGVSSFITSSIRGEAKTAAWESFSLGEIANEIAISHDLELFWDADNVDFERVDQRDESDLAFLQRLCEENGFNLKVAEGLLIVFQGDTFEGQPEPVIITRGQSPIISYEIATEGAGYIPGLPGFLSGPEDQTDPRIPFRTCFGCARVRTDSQDQRAGQQRSRSRKKGHGGAAGTKQGPDHGPIGTGWSPDDCRRFFNRDRGLPVI